MLNREHVIVAYGQELGYHHGAKFQILSAWNHWYSRPDVGVCVVTDKPDLFKGYPIRILEITSQNFFKWSLNGLQHFGIKLRAFEYAMQTSQSLISLLLDTDTYWIKNPECLVKKICDGQAIMFCDEGSIKGSRNLSINRFNEALTDQAIAWGDMTYQLTTESRMLNSSIIGLHKNNIEIIDKAFHLFSALEPLVDAHTVEQFSLGETLRLENIKVNFGASYTRDWSSIGRKNYVTPILYQFFNRHGENDFSSHLANLNSIEIRRPANVFIRQKLAKLCGKN